MRTEQWIAEKNPKPYKGLEYQESTAAVVCKMFNDSTFQLCVFEPGTQQMQMIVQVAMPWRLEVLSMCFEFWGQTWTDLMVILQQLKFFTILTE